MSVANAQPLTFNAEVKEPRSTVLPRSRRRTGQFMFPFVLFVSFVVKFHGFESLT